MKKPRSKYTQRTDGEGFEIPCNEVYKLACCDCGLVHQIVLVAPGVKKGVGIGIAVRRDNRATGQRRRHMINRAKPLKKLLTLTKATLKAANECLQGTGKGSMELSLYKYHHALADLEQYLEKQKQ